MLLNLSHEITLSYFGCRAIPQKDRPLENFPQQVASGKTPAWTVAKQNPSPRKFDFKII